MKINTTCTAMLMALLILSCNKAENKSKIQNIEMEDVAIASTKSEEKQPFNTMSADSTAISGVPPDNILQAGKPALLIDWDKKIIKTANVVAELKDYALYNQFIHNNTKRYGAYIASEQQQEVDGKIENNVSIKVPVDQFEAMMNALPADNVKIIEKRITTEDVTGEVVDTKSRTQAKKEVRDRYLDLLKQAKNMKEILEVQNEINSIQEDIEAGSGRVEYLVHQSAYSTINLKYYQYLSGIKLPDETPTFFARVKEAFYDGTSIITGILLVTITFWPLLLSALLLWYLVKKHAFGSAKVAKKV